MPQPVLQEFLDALAAGDAVVPIDRIYGFDQIVDAHAAMEAGGAAGKLAHARHHRGPPARFEPFSQLFRQALERFGQPDRPVGVHSPGHVAATDGQARDEFWPHYLEVIRNVGKTRGFAVPTKESFLHETGPHGALYVGSPETVARKIAANLPALGATRFDLKYGMGGLSYDSLLTNIELYGTEVVPRVRDLLADPPVADPAVTGTVA